MTHRGIGQTSGLTRRLLVSPAVTYHAGCVGFISDVRLTSSLLACSLCAILFCTRGGADSAPQVHVSSWSSRRSSALHASSPGHLHCVELHREAVGVPYPTLQCRVNLAVSVKGVSAV